MKFKHILKSLFIVTHRLTFLLKKVNIFKFNFNDVNADYIIWVPEFYSLSFWASDNFIRLFAVISSLRRKNIDQISIFTRINIGQFIGKKIIYFPHNNFNIFSFPKYIDVYQHIHINLELNNLVLPKYSELIFWENKAYMHNIFSELNIRTPKTYVSKVSLEYVPPLNFPFLLKEEHSCSSNGVHKINDSINFYEKINSDNYFINNKFFICQELLNIRRDLRVIIVGDVIVHFYWRINLSKEWRPTATSFGSEVDFINFPNMWKDWIIKTFRKLGLSSGAFDIAWQNDDLTTEPYILEVSPLFQPNPKPVFDISTVDYGKWKKSLSFTNSYQIEFTKLVFDIQDKIIDQFINNLDS
jgi:hypothetical protein